MFCGAIFTGQSESSEIFCIHPAPCILPTLQEEINLHENKQINMTSHSKNLGKQLVVTLTLTAIIIKLCTLNEYITNWISEFINLCAPIHFMLLDFVIMGPENTMKIMNKWKWKAYCSGVYIFPILCCLALSLSAEW